MTRDRVITTNIVNAALKEPIRLILPKPIFVRSAWLEKELEILQPKVIVALGSVALHYLGSRICALRATAAMV